MTRYTLLILAFLGFIGVCQARSVQNIISQSIRMSGYGYYGGSRTVIMVEDKETQDPLIGATVTIASKADTLRGTTTKENFYRIMAVYSCDRIFRDSVDLEVSYVGYKPFKKRYASTNFRGRIEVKMEVDEQSIAQVVVVGKQIAMVFKGDTTVYNAGAFKTMADDRLGELLKQLPGVEIKENQIYADGQQVKRVLIDGKNFFGTNPQHALTDLEASDVKNVRVYEDLSPEAKRMGNTTAEKEKVMNVETKSKRSVLQGGNVEATLGASLEQDYSGRNEIRHLESGNYYRNSEKGNWRFDASNSKDNGQKEVASSSSKVTPSKQTDIRAEYTYRRGDSTNIFTAVNFGRTRESSISRSRTEYFPTDTYHVRIEENTNESLSKGLTASIINTTGIQRKKSSFSAYTDFSFSNGSSFGRRGTLQQIDEEQTRTLLNNNADSREYSLNINLNYSLKLSERSRLGISASGRYSTNNQDGWQVDTLSTTSPGLQIKLRNNGDGRQYNITTSVDYSYKLGKRGSFSASYNFSRDYNRSKQLAVDFLNDPRGIIDTVNSYNYTTDTYTHSIQTYLQYRHEDVWISAGLGGILYDIARSERFPEDVRSPRQFYTLSPAIYLSIGKSKRRFNLNINSFPQPISTESLRSTIDATNPLSLRAGNPNLKMQNNFSGSAGFSFNNAKKAITLGIRVNGGYSFNYVATRRTLFLEDTYLSQYDYTARKGSQLTTQVNVKGCYNMGSTFSYSQQIAGIRSTIHANVGYNFNQTPYFLKEALFHATNHSLRFGIGFNSGFSTKVKISILSSTSMSSNTSQNTTTQALTEQLSGRVDLRFGKYFGSVGSFYEFYCDSRSHTSIRHNVILNASAGRKFGKDNRFGCSVGVIDILNRPDYANTRFESDYIITSSTSYLGRYGYVKVDYMF